MATIYRNATKREKITFKNSYIRETTTNFIKQRDLLNFRNISYNAKKFKGFLQKTKQLAIALT